MIALCECGCGRPAPISDRTRPQKGYVKGQPRRFISGHNAKLRGVRPRKYRKVGLVPEHLLIAENALGRPLVNDEQVHHVDGDTHNNEKRNLVICQDTAYHFLLHVRTRVLKAGGNPNTQRVCYVCGLPKGFASFPKDRTSSDRIGRRCRECNAAYCRMRRAS